jgi:secreted trypsin-like serine protease
LRVAAARSAALALFMLCACADPEPRGDGFDSTTLAIVHGDAASDPAVVALVHDDRAFCTGTLISRRVVVTAAHCVPPNLDTPVDEIEVFFGERVDQPGARVGVATALAHAGWSADSVPNDIGLVALVEDAPAAPARMGGALDAHDGDQVRLVGFGRSVAEAHDSGVKREGTALVEDVDQHTIYLEASPSLTCNGDSGGPLFVAEGIGPVLAGIHSRSDCETVSLNERLDVHLAFVHPFVAEHDGPECAPDGSCNEDCLVDADCDDSSGEEIQGESSLTGGCAAAPGGGLPFGLGLGLALATAAIRRRRGPGPQVRSGPV